MSSCSVSFSQKIRPTKTHLSSHRQTWLAWPCKRKARIKNQDEIVQKPDTNNRIGTDASANTNLTSCASGFVAASSVTAAITIPTKRLSFSNTCAQREKRNKRMPRFNSVSKIDRASRVFFPLVFFLINVFYWYSYLTKSERWATALVARH